MTEGRKALGVQFVLSGLIFLIVTVVLYIIPLIKRLLANKKDNLTQCVFLQCICYRSVFQQRNIVRQTDTVSLLPLRCFPHFSFLDR